MAPLVPLFADANRWLIALPPIWMVGAGAAATLLATLAGYALLRLAAPRLAAEARASLGDGFLGPVAWLLLAASAVAVAFTPLVPLDQIYRSLSRLTSANDFQRTVTVPAGATLQEIPLDLRPQELATLRLASDVPLIVRTQQPVEGFALVKEAEIPLTAGKPWSWTKSEGATNPFLGQRAKLEATNSATTPATLSIGWQLEAENPQAAVLPWTFFALSGLVACYALFRLGAPRIAAVAAATTKEAIGQPVFTVAIVAGIALLVSFIAIPYNTFGEDVKMLKDSGLTLIKVLALLVVVWTASVSVAEEIDGRTALTVLSKPLSRWQFVLGKFAGLVLVATLVFLILGAVLLSTTSLKVVYDARESSKTDPLWRECAGEMITVVPGLVLSLLETILMSAVSLAVSTRLGMVPNLIICFTVYALGHLVPLIVQSSVGKFAIVRFVGKLLATLLPVLDHFTIEAAVVGGMPVPWSYLGWAAVYAALYSTLAILVALVLFQDRDLA
jgi:ABC-type transport system involved in multi-copper enzyme maturation permease subunit